MYTLKKNSFEHKKMLSEVNFRDVHWLYTKLMSVILEYLKKNETEIRQPVMQSMLNIGT